MISDFGVRGSILGGWRRGRSKNYFKKLLQKIEYQLWITLFCTFNSLDDMFWTITKEIIILKQRSKLTFHSSFEQEKTVSEILLGLWTCFRAYRWILSRPRWNILPWKYCKEVALQSIFQKVVEIKIWHHFEYKKPFVTPNFCGRNFSAMHHLWVWIFLSPRINE